MSQLPASTPPVVSFVGVSKRFGATRALDDVSMDLLAGEVHVLAGENGAGKSTLIRILAGVIGEFDGEVRLLGARTRFASPADARRAGVATIHQELSLIGSMTVSDNIALGSGGLSAWRLVAGAEETARAREVLALLSLDVDPGARVETLPLATRQLIEIARALSQDVRVLIMDEPTSALSEGETARLFHELDTLRERGVAIVFISHRMDDIYRIADRITVIRDGAHVITAAAADLPRSELIGHMIGDARPLRDDRAASSAGTTMLAVQRDNISIEVSAGEVLGITGLHGSGADALPGAIFGAVPADISVTIAGHRVPRLNPRSCIARGMILLSGDREHSLVQMLSVVANTVLSALASSAGGLTRVGFVQPAAAVRAAESARDRFDIDCPSLHADVCTLSGGNQQKVAIARCLQIQPRVLLLHEPTRGIDVGAKAEVHALIGELAAAGVAIVVVGTDLEELMSITDRMLVMSSGALALTLERGEYDRAHLLSAAMGASQ